MHDQFEFVYRVSGGWAQARLTLEDETALIEYDSASMGQVPVRYRMQCEHNNRSDYYGLLRMVSLERDIAEQNQYGGYTYTGAKETVNLGSLMDPNAEEEVLPLLNQFDLEYIRLPEPQFMLDEPGGNWGIHERNDTFSLILLVHFAGFGPEDQFTNNPLGRGLKRLDRMYMAVAQGKYALHS